VDNTDVDARIIMQRFLKNDVTMRYEWKTNNFEIYRKGEILRRYKKSAVDTLEFLKLWE
jgi:hypothetical protein